MKTNIKLVEAYRSDLRAILEIERKTMGEHALSEKQYLSITKSRNVTPVLITIDRKIVGYAIYALTDEALEIVRFVILSDFQHKGIGTEILTRLKNKRRGRIKVFVREHNVVAQLWLRKNEFTYKITKKDFFNNPVEDAYIFTYGINECTT